MNIKIPHSWLKEYLKTKANPQKIADCLSLCSASVEKIEKIGNDWVYDIEVTTNRVDMMSVAGIAREAATVLPQFGIKARLKKDPYNPVSSIQYPVSSKIRELKIVIKNKSLCPRFTAVVLENIKIEPSHKTIRSRLKKAGIRSLNNIIDLSNYLMRAFGQPVHTFDYNKILEHKMILRESKKGEKITTLDGKTFKLHGKDIVIEDGKGRLIDLCGIMGAANSAIDSKTEKVLLFVQNYKPSCIRYTSMTLAQRTEAAQLFEKGIDQELVLPTILEGINLAKKMLGAKVASKIIDIYPKAYKPKTLNISLQLIEQRLGIKLHPNKVKKILTSLGFQLKTKKPRATSHELVIAVPSWRAHDITIPEDIIEEVARLYGYHNLPSKLPTGQLPTKPPFAKNFYWEEKIKNLLKNWGLTETYTYSFVSKELLQKFNQDPKKHLKLKNPLTSDWEYMRTSIIPSLLEVITQNKNTKENIKIFELANVYKLRKNKLPEERAYLVIAFYFPSYHPGNFSRHHERSEGSPEEHFFQLKGLIEVLLGELSIVPKFKTKDISEVLASLPAGKAGSVSEREEKRNWLVNQKSLDIFSSNERLGMLGQLKPALVAKFDIKKQLFIAELDFAKIAKLASDKKTYTPIPKYPPIIEDLTFEFTEPILYTKVVSLIKKTSSLIKQVELVGQYKNKKTFRLYYQHADKSLTDKEVGKVRKVIVQNLQKEGLKLIGQVL